MLLSISIACKEEQHSGTRDGTVQPAPAGRGVHYTRRRPEDTALYQLVQEYLESFLAQVELETGAGLPDFVKEEFDAFLRVVFPQGLVETGDDLLVYYGAADVSVAAARVRKRDLVASLAEAIKLKQGGGAL